MKPTICARLYASWNRSSARRGLIAKCWLPNIAAPRWWVAQRKARQVVGIDQEQTFGRMKSKVHVRAAENAAASEILSPETLEDKFKALESEDKVEMLLNELKSKVAANG